MARLRIRLRLASSLVYVCSLVCPCLAGLLCSTLCSSAPLASAPLNEWRFRFRVRAAAEKAAEGKLSVRGATVAKDGKCSQWTEWHKVSEPVDEQKRKEEEAAAVRLASEEARDVSRANAAEIAKASSIKGKWAERNPAPVLNLPMSRSLAKALFW